MEAIRSFLTPENIDKVIYHKNCSDGFGAAFCVWLYRKMFGYDENIEYIPMDYNDCPPNVDGSNVLIVDFSFKRPVTINLIQKANKLVILDHHKSAEEDLKNLDNVYFDMNMSGAMLAWKYCFPSFVIPKLIELIQDRDLWQWKLQGSKEFSAVFMDVPFNFEEYERFLDPIVMDQAIQKGHIIQAYIQNCVEKNAKKAAKRDFMGFKCRILNCGLYISEIGNELANMDDCDVALLWRYDHDTNKYYFSARSIGDIDTTIISKKFGGGGHRNASGFTVDNIPSELV